MEYLKELFGYNIKFTDGIIKSLRTIDPEKFLEVKVSAWGSLRDLVMHLIEAEDFWINKAVQNKPFTAYDFQDYQDIDIIEKRWKEIDADILLYLNSIAPNDLSKTVKVKWDKEYTFPLEKVLQHLYTHTVHTRGQVVAGIRMLNGDVPCVDII